MSDPEPGGNLVTAKIMKVMLQKRHGVTSDVSWQFVTCLEMRKSCCRNVMESMVTCHDNLWRVLKWWSHAAETSWSHWSHNKMWRVMKRGSHAAETSWSHWWCVLTSGYVSWHKEVTLHRCHGVTGDVSSQVVTYHDTRRSCCSNVMVLLVICRTLSN